MDGWRESESDSYGGREKIWLFVCKTENEKLQLKKDEQWRKKPHFHTHTHTRTAEDRGRNNDEHRLSSVTSREPSSDGRRRFEATFDVD